MKEDSTSEKISTWKEQVKSESTWWEVVEAFAQEMTDFLENAKAAKAEPQKLLAEATEYLEFAIWLTSYGDTRQVDYKEDSRWEKFEYAQIAIHDELEIMHGKFEKSE